MNKRYRPNIAAYLAIGGIPSFILWAAAWGNSGVRTDWKLIVIATALSVFLFACTARYQITTTPDEVIFRGLFRKRTIRHDQIRKVRLVWLGLSGRHYADRFKAPLRLVIDPREGSGAQRLDINAKVFSREATEALIALGARVAKADDGGLLDGVVMKGLREASRQNRK
jgi:hypothetical protein